VVLTLPSAHRELLAHRQFDKDSPEPGNYADRWAIGKIEDWRPRAVATGSFQAGVGVGATSGAGFVNPLVNTQFQYIDVGVNVDMTPHVHPNRDVSMKVSIEVSSVTGTSTIVASRSPSSPAQGGARNPPERGEVSILGGLIQRTDTRTSEWLAGCGADSGDALPLLRG